MEFRRNRYGGLFPINNSKSSTTNKAIKGTKKPVQSTSDPKSKIKTGVTGKTKKEVVDKVKNILGKDTKVFNNFENKSKSTDNNASHCKKVAREHKNAHTGYIITKQTINNKIIFSTIAHDFNVSGNKALDYINHDSAKSQFKNQEIVAYIGKPLNYRKTRKKNK